MPLAASLEQQHKRLARQVVLFGVRPRIRRPCGLVVRGMMTQHSGILATQFVARFQSAARATALIASLLWRVASKCCRFWQVRHSFRHCRVQSRAAGLLICNELCTHSRIPVSPQMIRNADSRRVFAFGQKELPDLIGHIHKLGVVHLRHSCGVGEDFEAVITHDPAQSNSGSICSIDS